MQVHQYDAIDASCGLAKEQRSPRCTWRTVLKRACRGNPLPRPKEYIMSMSTESLAPPVLNPSNLSTVFRKQ
eukprot:3121764-Amphidinium_carterae.2